MNLTLFYFVWFSLAKLKQQAKEESEKAGVGEGGRGERVSLHQMKRERDYRRRRQKYRARNVHITRRTPAQVDTLKVFRILLSCLV